MMKQGWEIKKLGEVCSFERGLTYAKGDEVATSSKGVLRSNNIDLITNSLNYDEIKYLREDFEIPTKKMVRKNSLLMCISNGSKIHLGKVALIEDDIDYAFGGFMGLLTPNEAIIHPRYFYYALISPAYKMLIEGLSDGANINNLKFADLQSFEIPIPSLAEQKRIVEILDRDFERIDALKANAEQNLQHAKDLFQAALRQELQPKEGWEYHKLIDIYNFIDYRGATPNKTTSGIPLITAKNIKKGYLDYSIKDFISEKEYKNRQKRGISKYGDILFTTEAPLGNVAIADKVVYSAGQRVITFQKKEALTDIINNSFYLYYFIAPIFQEMIKSQASGLTAQGIKASRLKDINIPLPKIGEQDCIASRLNKLSEQCTALEENYRKTIALCDDMKQALLRKAFNGEL